MFPPVHLQPRDGAGRRLRIRLGVHGPREDLEPVDDPRPGPGEERGRVDGEDVAGCGRPASRRPRDAERPVRLRLRLPRGSSRRACRPALLGSASRISRCVIVREGSPLSPKQVRGADGLDHLGYPVARRERRLRPLETEHVHGRQAHRRALARRRRRSRSDEASSVARASAPSRPPTVSIWAITSSSVLGSSETHLGASR